ncbi:neuronal growth regulator 1-like [Hyla sarda]|uniref:neuronal growth regulator 1-like n=1 Tax=Hyla sarda TaxID=327740 RepID=UPI0024C31B29|nr:neuronal growth regulator 1-like [Hyla sarda]
MKLHLLFSVLIVVFNTEKGSGIPVPKLHFQDKIYEDEDTDITCTLQNTACLDVTLEIKGNATLTHCKETPADCSQNRYDTRKVCTVEITKDMDKMEFTCEAHFKIQSKPEKMYLQREPTITVCPDKLVWKEGEENSFQCLSDGYPQPNVTCRKDNLIYPVGEKFTTSRNMTGNFSCIARNFDEVSKRVEVSVQYKPKVVAVIVNPTLHNEGDAVTITCEADSNPSPTYSWETPSSDIQFSPNNKTVTIHKVSRSHLGTYRCTASNMHGSHSLQQELTLAAQPKILAIETEPSTEVLKGQNLTMTCIATGIPAPSLSWKHPSAMVETSKDPDTITIWNMSMEHAGNYTCTAQNKYGIATQSQKITLAVKPKVININVKPSTTVSENDNLTLTCVAQGAPRPTYSWHPLTPNVIPSPDKSSITIFAAQKAHAGDYSCTAENKHGRDTMTKHITVTGNRGDRSKMSITTLTMLIFTSLIFYLP